MHIDQIRQCLDSSDTARTVLPQWGLRDTDRGRHILGHVGASLGIEGLRELSIPLARLLPRCPDPDMALNNLERFLAHPDAALLLPTLLESRARTLEVMLQLFGTSQSFSDLLSVNPDFLDMLRIPLRRSPSTAEMQAQLQAEVDAAADGNAALRTFRRFRQRHMLRIGTNDIIRDRPLEEITRDLSRVADVSLEVALSYSLRICSAKFGPPFDDGGRPIPCVIMGFGKLGGDELNYSSDLDLMFLYAEEGSTRARKSIPTDEYFAKVVSEVLRLLSAHSDRGQAYRVDLRLRPRASGALWPDRSPARWPTTTRWVELGSAKP